jgi:8-oxo-dGTP diphosphatase
VAAAAAVLLEEARILLARRASSVLRGRWYIPAGFVEADETVETAAVREAKEETGLDVEIVELLAAHSGFEVPGRPVVGTYYLVRPVGGALQPGSDVDRLEYYPLDAVPDLPFEGDRVVVDLLRSRA